MTLQLFASEYNLPLIDPSIAAPLATTAESPGRCCFSWDCSRVSAALMLLGVVSVIQIFVFPENWAEHLLWASLLLLVLTRGAGVFSLDYVADRYHFGLQNLNISAKEADPI